MDPAIRQQALHALDRQLQPYNECLVARLRFLEALPLSERSGWTENFRKADRNGAAAVAWNTSDPHFDNDPSSHDDGLATLMDAFTNRCRIESTATAGFIPSFDYLSYSSSYNSLSDHEYDGDGDGDGEDELEICLVGSSHY
jgi:hypothetical protein